MNHVNSGAVDWKALREMPVPMIGNRVLHHLKAVRLRQGLSRRQVAEHMKITIDEVRQQECEDFDLPLSALYAWQKALDVPIAELLVDIGFSLMSPILERSQLLRLTKTVLAVRERARQESIRRMAQTMHDQLVEIMPELASVAPWHTIGKRRRLNELGATAQRCLAEEVFIDHGEWSVG